MTNTQRTDEQKTNPKPCKVGHCDGMCYCTESKPILTDESVVDIAEKIEEMYQSGKYDADFRKKLIVNTLTSQSIKHKAEVEKARKEENERIKDWVTTILFAHPELKDEIISFLTNKES